jgi:outer membrane protein
MSRRFWRFSGTTILLLMAVLCPVQAARLDASFALADLHKGGHSGRSTRLGGSDEVVAALTSVAPIDSQPGSYSVGQERLLVESNREHIAPPLRRSLLLAQASTSPSAQPQAGSASSAQSAAPSSAPATSGTSTNPGTWTPLPTGASATNAPTTVNPVMTGATSNTTTLLTPAASISASNPGGSLRPLPKVPSKATAAAKASRDSEAQLPLLDLNACYRLAMARSEQLGIRWEEIQAAGSRYWQAISAIFPTVSIGSAMRWQNESANIGPGGVGIRGNRFQSALQLHQPLFSGFREFHAAAGATAQKKAASADWQRLQQTIYQDVAALFYQILMYEEDERVLAQIGSVLNTQVTEFNRRVELGRSRPADRLSAEAEAADVAALLEQTRGLRRVSKEMLAFWTGIPADRLRLANTQRLPAVQDLALYLQGALIRPDVEATRQRERAAGSQVGVVRADYWPQVGVDANYYLETGRNDSREWDVALTVDLPIFSGFSVQAREGEAKAQLRQAVLRLSEIERTAQMETRVAYTRFIAASRELVELNQLAETATRNARTQEGDYQRGIANYLQVLDAQRQALNARRREAEARQRAQRALAELAVAAGETPITGTGGLVP